MNLLAATVSAFAGGYFVVGAAGAALQQQASRAHIETRGGILTCVDDARPGVVFQARIPAGVLADTAQQAVVRARAYQRKNAITNQVTAILNHDELVRIRRTP